MKTIVLFLILSFNLLAQSELIIILGDAATPPSTPTTLAVVGAPLKETITVNETGIDSIRLYRGTSTNPTTWIASIAPSTTYKDSGLTYGTVYFYRAKSLKSGLLSGYSLNVSDTAQATLTVLANMEVWYRGESGLSASGWNDQSGNSKNLHFNTAIWTPTLTGTKNTIPTAQFDGVNDHTDSVLYTTTSWTVYMVVKNGNHTNFDYFCDGGGASTMALRQGASAGVLQIQSSNVQAFGESVSAGTWVILTAQCSPTGTQKLYAKTNNNTIAGGTLVGALNTGGFILGSKFDKTNYGNFEVVEIIIYDAFHNAATITSVINYLNSKYGIY